MNNLSKKILAKIESQKISPRGKWIFFLKNYGVWIAVVLGIIFVGIFLSNVIHEFVMGEWDIYARFPGGKANFIFHTIPFLWLLGIISAFAFAYFLFRKTRRGYRFGILTISGAIFIVSGICGIALFSTPLPPKFREFRMQHFQSDFDSQKWMNPSEGFLFGEILEAETEGEFFILNAIDNSVWEVDISIARIPRFLELRKGEDVRVIGEQIREGKFKADFVKSGNLREDMHRLKKFKKK